LAMTTSPSIPPTERPEGSAALGAVIQTALVGTKGKYSVVVKNLKTNEFYRYQDHQSYKSGSLYKLWIMAVAFQQLQKGQIKESDVLSDEVEDLNNTFDIASESAELHEGSVTFPVKQALTQMITISHNYAALLLAQKVKLSSVDTFLKTYNYKESKIGEPPKTTASDIALFLEDLYKRKIANTQRTEEMITLLKNQKLNNKLPKYLPPGTVIAHKTGELDSVTHDAGIVYSEKGDYIIVVMTDTAIPDAAEDRIGEISKAVYEYFEKS
jgi:beta-lactamase class A